MDIAIFTMQLGAGYRHGTERYVETLGTCLRRRGHRVDFLAGDPQGLSASAPLGAVVDESLGLRAHPSRGWMTVSGECEADAERWLARRRPDLVHLVNPAHVGVGVASACARLGIPLVVTTMDFWWVCPRATLLRNGERRCDGAPGWRECLRCISTDHPRPLVRSLARLPAVVAPVAFAAHAASWCARSGSPAEVIRWVDRRRILKDVLDQAAGIVFPSPALRDRVSPLLSHDRWQLIPYGLEEAWLESPRARDEKPWDPTQLILGFAGSLQPHKGADLLLEALRILRWDETRVRIAGSADRPAYRNDLERRYASLAVEFAGELGSAAMRDFLRTLDVLVVPSRWDENLPFVLLEGQAAGIPVIASRVPGMAHRIRDRRRLFEPGSAGDLARALADFAADPSELPAPSVDGVDAMTSATEAVYREAVARASGRGGRPA